MFGNPYYFEPFSEPSGIKSEIPLMLMISHLFAKYEQNSIILIIFYNLDYIIILLLGQID